jgi:hypothetical protein
MKNFTLLFLLVVAPLSFFAQSKFATDFEPIRKELISWDEVRGEWLAASLESIVYNEAIPNRTFPEDFTPAEMLRIVPTDKRSMLSQQIEVNQRNSTENSQANAWRELKSIFAKASCNPVRGRSYGDPHLTSFDGANFSFQTVGEFVLAKSNSGKFEVQSRQRPQRDDFSLNTAVAMNVGGDRVCLYPNEKPDRFENAIIRVNGEPIAVENNTYFLPRGGTIRVSKRNYYIDWPSGETATFDHSRSGSIDFMNITVQIYPCAEEEYAGLLGNANRNSMDDFNSRNRTPQTNFIAMMSFGNDEMDAVAEDMEKQQLTYIAKDFASEWRLTPENTLFDYGIGENTYTFTDLRFPMVHRTVRDLNPTQRDNARRLCEQQGLNGAELRACIYDQGFLQIDPIKPPVIKDRTEGVVLTKVERKPIITDSDKEVEGTKRAPSDEETTKEKVNTESKKGSSDTEAKPIDKNTNTEKGKTNTVSTKPVKTSTPVISTPVKTNTESTKPVKTSTPVISNPVKTNTESTKPVKTSTPVISNPVKTNTEGTKPVKTSTPTTNPVKTTPVKTSTPAIRKG